MATAKPGGPWGTMGDQQGFLHRLDVPSSGLILAAKSFRSYYDLQAHLGGFTASSWYSNHLVGGLEQP